MKITYNDIQITKAEGEKEMFEPKEVYTQTCDICHKDFIPDEESCSILKLGRVYHICQAHTENIMDLIEEESNN